MFVGIFILLYFNTLIKCVLDDFDKAKRKLKKSEVHADLNTDVEKEKKSRKKRKKKQMLVLATILDLK